MHACVCVCSSGLISRWTGGRPEDLDLGHDPPEHRPVSTVTCGDKYLHSSGCRYEPVQAGYLHNTVVLSNTVVHVHQQGVSGCAEEDLSHLDLGAEPG